MIRIPARMVALVVLAFAALSPSVAAAADPQQDCTQLPSNIEVTELLEPFVSSLLLKSQTFRRQCAIIAAQDRVHVRIEVSPLREPNVRARAQITRLGGGGIRALIEVPPAADYAELVPHELEHVLEQIEGLDLSAMARSGDGGVVELADGVFETARAQAAGVRAATEFHGEMDPAFDVAAKAVARAWRAVCARAARDGHGAAKTLRLRAGVHKDF